jgi:hypothetical protein
MNPRPLRRTRRATIPWVRSLGALVLLACAFGPGVARAQAVADARVALVIGNAAYATAPLLNPANDARAMGEALRGRGFEVIEIRDASKAQMAAAIESARRALNDRHGVALLYYAGHGVQSDWHNYMVPVDARLAKSSDIASQTVDVESVIDAFKAASTRMNILVLDACRDNPFPAANGGKGLAPLDAPPGTFLAYATAPGNVAEDGTVASGHGLYTEYLIQELAKPDAKIEDVFKRVRTQVRQQSQGRQIPWESTSLEDDFYFDGQKAKGSLVELTLDAPAGLKQAESDFDAEKAEWDRIRDSAQAADFFSYLQSHPSGYMSEQAQYRLDQLQQPRIQAQLKPGAVAGPKDGERRYRVGDAFEYERVDAINVTRASHVDRVVSADDRRVVFDTGIVYDQMGSTLKNRFGEKDPGVLVVPSDLAVGKRWRSAFTNTNSNGSTRNFWEFQVTGMEEIDLPSGHYTTFKVDRNGAAASKERIMKMTGTTWIDAQTMFVVKEHLVFFAGGRRTVDQTSQLLSMNLVPR